MKSRRIVLVFRHKTGAHKMIKLLLAKQPNEIIDLIKAIGKKIKKQKGNSLTILSLSFSW